MNYARLEVLEREQSDKNFARNQVYYAVKTGRLTKEPCACGETKVEGHHPDYKKPLEVIWMCRQCHSQLHKEMNRRPETFAPSASY